jgi:hypothetical protein
MIIGVRNFSLRPRGRTLRDVSVTYVVIKIDSEYENWPLFFSL